MPRRVGLDDVIEQVSQYFADCVIRVLGPEPSHEARLRAAAGVELRVIDVLTDAVHEEVGEGPVREVEDIAAIHAEQPFELPLLGSGQVGHDSELSSEGPVEERLE